MLDGFKFQYETDGTTIKYVINPDDVYFRVGISNETVSGGERWNKIENLLAMKTAHETGTTALNNSTATVESINKAITDFRNAISSFYNTAGTGSKYN